jgi:predicted Rossmann fold nucleotide-binding protein DprA/Smf involved in DNA uptake
LLGRGGALGLALEKWHRAGLWVLTRLDSEYPGRLRKRLKAESPPVLFGCGNKRLLNQGGIAAVGSRNSTESDLTFTNHLGVAAAAHGYSIVSGGARGVDQAAMFAALQSEGTVVGVLANNLLRSVTSAEYRKHLKTNNLVLVSPFNPEAGFNVGNMMARNRYIYCLADAAVVVSSTPDKGGTWHGAIEDLKAGWVPLWVKKSCARNSGNTELVRRGAKEWSQNDFPNLINLFDNVPSRKEPLIPDDLNFNQLFLHHLGKWTSSEALTRDEICERLKRFNIQENQASAWLEWGVMEKRVRKLDARVRYQCERRLSAGAPPISHGSDFNQLFLHHLTRWTSSEALTRDEICERLRRFNIQESQVGAWLEWGVGSDSISRRIRPAPGWNGGLWKRGSGNWTHGYATSASGGSRPEHHPFRMVRISISCSCII